ncbi:putative amino acid permease [Rickettsiales endosymbiont of Paramecium tredecaurelia]|uniref:amino acid permease n=1 Tax=Candidatus Sarmatiella mevalonica TaxID=2770581 RepID=UPI001923ADBF|nr:putative amino acid permease [Candidatus Sarmatiella mevalonica]
MNKSKTNNPKPRVRKLSHSSQRNSRAEIRLCSKPSEVKQIGFWALLSIVIGSQIGSGILTLPSSLAPYGAYSLWGWCFSGIGAICLALTFAYLAQTAKTNIGGPQSYARSAFGDLVGFFVGWTYWVISWLSTTAVIGVAVSSLSPFLPNYQEIYFWLELLLLAVLTLLNLYGTHAVGMTEIFLSAIKVLPLIIIPILALPEIEPSHFTIPQQVESLSAWQILYKVTMFTLWCFIGVETATIPMKDVENARSLIPKALVIGTTIVAAVYFINSVSILGVIPAQQLAQSNAPYVDVIEHLLGHSWHLSISILTSLICIGTINSWIFSASQISRNLAYEGLMPSFFAHLNSKGAPVYSILISSLLMVPFMYYTASGELAKQIDDIINLSVLTFIFVYFICAISMIKLMLSKRIKFHVLYFIAALVSVIFCILMIVNSSSSELICSALFALSGLPFLPIIYKVRQDDVV